jgi:multiple sugar transport system permease protein
VYLPNYFGKYTVFWGEIGATSVMAMLPMFVMSLIVQRYLVRGLTMGAVK